MKSVFLLFALAVSINSFASGKNCSVSTNNQEIGGQLVSQGTKLDRQFDADIHLEVITEEKVRREDRFRIDCRDILFCNDEHDVSVYTTIATATTKSGAIIYNQTISGKLSSSQNKKLTKDFLKKLNRSNLSCSGNSGDSSEAPEAPEALRVFEGVYSPTPANSACWMRAKLSGNTLVVSFISGGYGCRDDHVVYKYHCNVKAMKCSTNWSDAKNETLELQSNGDVMRTNTGWFLNYEKQHYN